MPESNWPGVIDANNPVARDPQWQRRVLVLRKPWEFIDNIHEVVLECGHEPLLLGTEIPAVGGTCFCPDCYQAAQP